MQCLKGCIQTSTKPCKTVAGLFVGCRETRVNQPPLNGRSFRSHGQVHGRLNGRQFLLLARYGSVVLLEIRQTFSTKLAIKGSSEHDNKSLSMHQASQSGNPFTFNSGIVVVTDVFLFCCSDHKTSLYRSGSLFPINQHGEDRRHIPGNGKRHRCGVG